MACHDSCTSSQTRNVPCYSGIFAFVVLSAEGRSDDECMLRASLKSRVATEVGVFAVPDIIMVSGVHT